jgi:hypothetical protein
MAGPRRWFSPVCNENVTSLARDSFCSDAAKPIQPRQDERTTPREGGKIRGHGGPRARPIYELEDRGAVIVMLDRRGKSAAHTRAPIQPRPARSLFHTKTANFTRIVRLPPLNLRSVAIL